MENELVKELEEMGFEEMSKSKIVRRFEKNYGQLTIKVYDLEMPNFTDFLLGRTSKLESDIETHWDLLTEGTDFDNEIASSVNTQNFNLFIRNTYACLEDLAKIKNLLDKEKNKNKK